MQSNSLPLNYSQLFRVVRILKGGKKNNQSFYSENNTVNLSLRKMEVTDIEKIENKYIENLFSPLRPYEEFVDVYLHGSWADDTKTFFSDIDDFIVLDLKALEEQGLLLKLCNILNRIDMKFCRTDPIQHHGHWICSKSELTNYDNSFIPLHILNDSRVVLGSKTIKGKINVELSEKGLKKNIKNTCRGIKKLSTKLFENSINAYQLKGLIGSFALMPAFIIQVNGQELTKPEAIIESGSFFSDTAHICIEWATNCRNNWGIITETRKFKIFSLLSYLFTNPHLWRRFSSKISPQVQEQMIYKLSNKNLSHKNVNEFISESLQYAE